MLFLFGETLMLFGAIYFCIIMIAARNPNNHQWWIKPMMTESLHMLVILGSLIMGFSLLVKGAMDFDLTKNLGIQAISFVALLAVALFVIKKLNVKQQLAKYDAMRSAISEVITIPIKAVDHNHTPTPAQKAA